jgi:hypothetical protein
VNGAAVGATENGAGVGGYSNGGIGVIGADAGSGRGVSGSSESGVAVVGETTSGIGVYAASAGGGTALVVEGVAVFSRSGSAKVKSGAASVTVTGVSLTSTSIVLATPQGNQSGVSVKGVIKNVSDSKFTIYLTADATAALEIGWFVIG